MSNSEGPIPAHNRGQQRRALSAFVVIIAATFLSYLVSPRVLSHAVPVLLIAFPLILQKTLNLTFSPRDLLLGAAVSCVVLLPFSLFEILAKKSFLLPSPLSLIYQLIVVSLPEEAFFRGLLQESLGNTTKGIITTSILFSLAHLPKALFFGDWIALLSFIPSLVMGWLYKKTHNILPGTIFHFFSNAAVAGFNGIHVF